MISKPLEREITFYRELLQDPSSVVTQPGPSTPEPVDLNLLQLRGRQVKIKSRRQSSPLKNTTEKCGEDMKLTSFLVFLVASFTKDYTFIYMVVHNFKAVSSP